MINIEVKDSTLKEASQRGPVPFVEAVMDAIDNAIGGNLDADSMSQLNSDQITLLAYRVLREEVLVGGFVQLIHNGYGAFIFRNPFAKAMKMWGVQPLGQLVQKAHKYYSKYHEMIEQDMDDDDFMALYEKCPEFDDCDDTFVDNEETYTSMIAYYIDGNIQNFVNIVHSGE